MHVYPLYSLLFFLCRDRGPHTFWLKNGTVNSNPDGIVNMLHYEDAASAAIAAVLRGAAGTAYLAADDEPLTREEICKSALASGRFPGANMPVVRASVLCSSLLGLLRCCCITPHPLFCRLLRICPVFFTISQQFTAPTGPIGKTCESRRTREAIQWSPRHEHRTFANYMRNTLGGDATFETDKQRKARVRREKAGGGTGSDGAGGAAADDDVSSLLWIPGADDDLDSDIFQL